MHRIDEIISERHVQAIWYDGALRPEGLRTADGAPVRVVDPGRWNLEAGPDFRDAVVEVGEDGHRIRGDVEVHMRVSDWAAHGHGHDPAYDGVVAHVTWYPGPPPVADARQLPPRCVRICLGDSLRTRPDFSPEEIDLAAYPYARLPATPRPCEAAFAHAPDAALALLRAAGERRLEGKARRLCALFVRTGDRAQTFYEEMMAAFGYKHNAAPFRALAQTLPWRELPPTLAVNYPSIELTAEALRPLSDLYSEKGEAFSLLVGERGDPSFQSRYKRMVKAVLFDMMGKPSAKFDVRANIISEYTASAIIGAISYWYQHREELPPEKYASLLLSLLSRGVLTTIFQL